ncbi:MAG: restriction endonuclease subunit S [Eubacterium sp.]|nr:restriction endonuclease subunit S [Eubacterium sp.]
MPCYKFSDLAYNITDKKMPEPGDERTYIGLEHLDSGSLTVTRWGSEIELKGQKLVMKKGDILFGRRNTYLRRASVAPHDGIFSAHGMIFRPKIEVIDPDYFPFFIASDYFMNAAIRISVGSLSPTVNWKTLKELAFDIPTLERQRESAKILKAANELKESYQALLLKTDDLVKSQFIEMFGDPNSNTNGWTKLTVREAVKQGYIARPLDGNHGAKHPKGDDYVPEGVPFIMAQDLKDKQVDFGSCHFITEKQASTLKKGWAKTGDVLLTNKGTIGRVAIVQESEYEDMLLTPQITYYRCLKDIDNEYLAGYFITDFFVNQLEKLTTGTTRASVTITQQENLELIIPPVDMQREFVTFVKQSDKLKFELKQSIEGVELLIKSMIQQELN